MKLIANRNYYQKKNWERVEIDREVRNDKLRMTPEEMPPMILKQKHSGRGYMQNMRK